MEEGISGRTPPTSSNAQRRYICLALQLANSVAGSTPSRGLSDCTCRLSAEGVVSAVIATGCRPEHLHAVQEVTDYK